MKKAIICTTLTTLVIASTSFAHDGATGIVKQRMDMMSDVASSMKTLGQMIKGQNAYSADIAESAALKIEKHSKHFQTMFPKGSTQEPSEALPAIWQDWEEFQKLLSTMELEASELASIASTATNAEEIKNQFSTLGKTCGMCHEKFRLKK
jgi:cytochrome c556